MNLSGFVSTLVIYSLIGGFPRVACELADSEESAYIEKYSYCQAPTPNPSRYKPIVSENQFRGLSEFF